MTPSFTVERDSRGQLSAETILPMTIGGDRKLNITTCKSHDGRLVTRAHGEIHKDGVVTWEVFGDYRKLLASTVGRATAKSIEAQHRTAIEGWQELLNEAEQFYLDKGAKEGRDEQARKAAPAAAPRGWDEGGFEREDSPHIEDGVDNCNDAGTGEGRYHGRM